MGGPALRQHVVDFAVNDDFASISAFLGRISPTPGPPDGSPWRVDFARCKYLGPDAAAILFALISEARIAGSTWSVVPPAGPPPLLGFWKFSGLQAEASGTGEPDQENPNNETVRLRRFMRSSWNLPDPLVRIVQRHFPLSEEAEHYLRTCMGEVFQNIEDHSLSRIGGVYSARFLSAKRQVRIAIVDRGVGIRETLKNRYPELSDDGEALRRVVRGGFSSKSRARNMGVGLRNLANFSIAQGGEYTILSGSALIHSTKSSGEPLVAPLSAPFQGTAVFFTLNVDIE